MERNSELFQHPPPGEGEHTRRVRVFRGRGDDKRRGVTARGTLMLLGLCVFNFSPRPFRGSAGG